MSVEGHRAELVSFLLALPPPRKTRAELMKAIDFEYYGYLDEDDGVIVPLEQEYEKKCRSLSLSFRSRRPPASGPSFENGCFSSAVAGSGLVSLLKIPSEEMVRTWPNPQ